MLRHPIGGAQVAQGQGGQVANSRVEGLDRRLLLLTAAYGLFLIGLIVVANSGRAIPELLSVVRSVPGGDKTVHFVLGGTMALLLNLSLRAAHWRLGPLPIQKGSVLVVLLGTLEEFSQLAVRHRSFDLEDLAWDYAGIAVFGQLGAWIYIAAGRLAADPGDGP